MDVIRQVFFTRQFDDSSNANGEASRADCRFLRRRDCARTVRPPGKSSRASSSDRVADRGGGMVQKHAGSGIAHDLADSRALGGSVAVDLARTAGSLMRHRRAVRDAFRSVGGELCAIFAERLSEGGGGGGFVAVSLAVNRDHLNDGPGVSLASCRIGVGVRVRRGWGFPGILLAIPIPLADLFAVHAYLRFRSFHMA